MIIKAGDYIRIDRSKCLGNDADVGHNCWHPDIKPVAEVETGQVAGIETRNAFDGQIRHETTVAKVGRCNLNLVHPLTGPVHVKGAEPGDLLEVRIHDIVPKAFSFTVQVPGFGFLRDVFTEPHIIRWDIANGYATSADLPRVRVPGAPFMGVIGTAPSHELLGAINRREAKLRAVAPHETRRQRRHQATDRGHHAAYSGLYAGRPILGRRCAFGAGRQRELRHRDRNRCDLFRFVQTAQRRSAPARHSRSAVLPRRLLHDARDGRASALLLAVLVASTPLAVATLRRCA